MSTERYLLFLHGIRDDDPEREWLGALDDALRREGTKTVQQRGYKVLTPSYLDLLERDTEPKADGPTETYKRQSDDVLRWAAGRYWLALDSLIASGIRSHGAPASVLAKLPGEGVHADIVRELGFKDADRYRRSSVRRHAVLQRICAAIPSTGELVVIAHSLGSVVARDLIYHLPPALRLRLLITLGTPLALKPMREHLEDPNRRFPYEIMGPWINLVGAGDVVTGFRGLSQIYGQALDLFIDTGSFTAAHSVFAYLDNPTAAVALEWLDKTPESAPANHLLPERPLPQALLSLIVGAQYSLRLGAVIESREVRTRFGGARELVLATLANRISEVGMTHITRQELGRDNREWIRSKALDDDNIVAYLLSALIENPVVPYEIDVPRDTRIVALRKLARDLGRPEQFATVVAAAEKAARESQRDSKITLKRAALAVTGVAVILAAPALVLVAAPAGLAGGAAIVAGLAALGPGGMLGGIGIVGVLAGAGGVATGSALMAGTAAQVEQTVIFLQALARARHDLRSADLVVGPRNYPEWYALIEMEDVAADERERLSQFSDSDAPGVKELDRKLKTVDRALRWLRTAGLGPQGLPANVDEAV
jgi:hypothetical protein